MKIKKVWNMPHHFSVRYPIRTIKDNIRAVKNNTISFIKRGKYGVAPMDCWDLDSYMLTSFRNGLIMFKKDNIGYPGRGDADTPEKWDEILDRMIKLCDVILLDPIECERAEKIFNENSLTSSSEWMEEWKDEVENYREYREECKEELAELLVKWVDNLWW